MKENGMHDASDLDRAERDERHNPPAMCAHIRVGRHRTERPAGTIIREWWECDSGCGMHFRATPSEPLWMELLAAANAWLSAVGASAKHITGDRLRRAVDALTPVAARVPEQGVKP